MFNCTFKKPCNFSIVHLLLCVLYAEDEKGELSFGKNRDSNSTVRLNVGGKVFYVSWQLLLQIPESRLGKKKSWKCLLQEVDIGISNLETN